MSAVYGEVHKLQTNRDRFNEQVTGYYKECSILTLIRSGAFSASEYGIIDSFSMNYDGNLLQYISDQATDSVFGKGLSLKMVQTLILNTFMMHMAT